jgi:starch synthase
MQQILFATSELQPLAGTGGLGEVCRALPLALSRLGCDVRIAVPGYRQVLNAARTWPMRCEFRVQGSPGAVRILEGRLEDSGVVVYVVNIPELFDRGGSLYTAEDGLEWPDNINRFAAFSRAVVRLALGQEGLGWRPDVLHCHDWQTGLACILLRGAPRRPATVFTVHNMAYAGTGDRARFDAIGLPPQLFTPDALEFYGNFSLLKGGLAGADRITTVSPSYAREIQTPELGFGLDGLLRHRHSALVGVMNGVDYELWDPHSDRHIPQRYTSRTLARKRDNKRALQHALGLQESPGALLFGVVSRLAHQKGIDLFLAAIPKLLGEPVQFALLADGDPALQKALLLAAQANPGRVAFAAGFNAALAHQIVAAADALVMPSRYEPCGLAQLYALRYGTVPVVRNTGGLGDSVRDTTPATLAAGTATGIVFQDATAAALTGALRRALALFRDKKAWVRLQRSGMKADFSWKSSAQTYLEIYRDARPRAP